MTYKDLRFSQNRQIYVTIYVTIHFQVVGSL